MMNRYVIALNRLNIAKEQLEKNDSQRTESSLTVYEVAQLMDVVRKYPSQKIEHEALFTCGFSMN